MVMDGHTKSQEEKYSLSGFFKKKKKKINYLHLQPLPRWNYVHNTDAAILDLVYIWP